MKAAISFALFLAACAKQAPHPANDMEATAPVAKPAAPAPKAFVHEEKNELIEFDYGWSAEASAVPQLVDRFRKQMATAKANLMEGVKELKAMGEKEGIDFNPFISHTSFDTAGQSSSLLSLTHSVWEYTGGAHGNGGTASLLWDRRAAKEIALADLFADPRNMDRLLTQRWCDALNKEREERRDEPVSGDGMFDGCPRLADIAIIPADKDGNGKFERLMLVADPYVAGPYVEGSYEIELAVTSDLTAAIKGEYRPSFEVQPQ